MSTLQTQYFKMSCKTLLLNDICQIWRLGGCLLLQIYSAVTQCLKPVAGAFEYELMGM